MKLRRTKHKYKRVFDLYLIRNKMYEQTIDSYRDMNDLSEKNLKFLTLNFKKALYIIFKYHQKSKQILFLGIPKNSNIANKLNTKHLLISEMFNPKNMNKNNSKASLKNLKINPDLIVLFDRDDMNHNYETILKDAYKTKTPVIRFSKANSSFIYSKNNYLLQVNSNSIKNTNHVFFNLIMAMIKQTLK